MSDVVLYYYPESLRIWMALEMWIIHQSIMMGLQSEAPPPTN